MKKILLTGLAIVLTITAFAQWTLVHSTNGSQTNALLTIGSTVLAGSSNSMSVSSDNGTTWVDATYAPSGTFPVGEGIYSFAISGTNIYAGGAKSKVLLSVDNGSTWSQVSNTGMPLVYPGNNNIVHTLLVSGSKLLAGTDSGVYVSTNNASSWLRTSLGIPANVGVVALAKCGTIIFASGKNAIMYKSTDDGVSWSTVTTNFQFTPNLTSLAVIGTNIYAGTYQSGAYLSQNNGNTWTAINTGLPSHIDCFAVSGNTLFAGGYGSDIFVSYNNGSNWTEVGVPIGSAPSSSSLALNNGYIFAGAWDGGVWRMQSAVGIDEVLN